MGAGAAQGPTDMNAMQSYRSQVAAWGGKETQGTVEFLRILPCRVCGVTPGNTSGRGGLGLAAGCLVGWPWRDPKVSRCTGFAWSGFLWFGWCDGQQNWGPVFVLERPRSTIRSFLGPNLGWPWGVLPWFRMRARPKHAEDPLFSGKC